MGDLRSVEEIQNTELRRILAEVDPRGGSAPFSVEEKRKAYVAAVFRAGAPEPVDRTEDRTVESSAGKIPIRLYRPAAKTGERLPIVLYLHGGGMFSGDLDTHDPLCRLLANHVPALVVAIEYRLAPEHPYPAAKEDCFAVLDWLAASGSSLDADHARISVAGDSAGGNLAAVVSLMARERGAPKVTSQVLIYPMMDATLSSASLIENAFIPPFTLVDCVYSWQLYLGADSDRRDPFISPGLAAELTDLPPALVVTAEFDILADEGQLYVERLRSAGVHVEHEHYPDMVHGFLLWGGQVAAARDAVNRIVQFLQTHSQIKTITSPVRTVGSST